MDKIQQKPAVSGILKTKLFTKLEVNEKGSTPDDLPTLWGVCRVLRGLPFQLGYFEDSEGLLMRLFLDELWKLYAQVKQGPNSEMSRALEHLRNVPSDDLQNVARIRCLCSARALSIRLKPHDPVVLEAWLDYCQHYDKSSLRKDVFLCHYEKAYEEAKANQQITGSRTDGEKVIMVLMDYCYVAHYICHDRALAYRLSSELWDLTGAALAREEPPQAWSRGQDVNDVLQSVKALFKKSSDSPLTESERSNLKRFLENETHTKRIQGKDYREEAKDLRRLVVAFDECVDLDWVASY
ncbi:hypothetical protein FAGAP_1189 [Fusarium agapanthi]|uniref:Uncharacterized protein n=1 Tax=Fusarium agapanthi TaxID=1803897 RepID=A0A9P5BIT5_9HYPO|nr:hypothetical protein FAGAP_1189 [Fusarium agapanthi]